MQSSQRYSNERKGTRSALAWRFVALGLCSGAVFAGCSSESAQSPEEKNITIERGNMQLALTGVSPAGNVYRLRNALFTIRATDGGYETVASTEEDPESTFIYLELPAGEYSVTLHPGYTVEQVSAGAGPGPAPTSVPVPMPTSSVSSEVEVSTDAIEIESTFGRVNWPSQQASVRERRGKAAPVFAARATGDAGVITEEPVTAPVDYDAGAPTPGDAGPVPGELEVELISENPAYVYIYGYEVSQVRFSFLVNGAVVNTGSGALIIGADFYEGQTGSNDCSGDDPYEPNDFYSPASISTEETLYAFACVYNEDMYVFDAPVPEGEMFQIRVDFDGTSGDVDIELGTADYEYVTGSYDIEDSETVTAVSNGGAYLLHVYNLGPYSVPYSVQFSALGAANSCCEAGDTPGCSDSSVLACVCNIDSACCSSSFDEICVQEAIAECGAQCEQPAPTSTCCEAAPEPGCLDSDVQECVCGIDPTCCTSTFDENCANLAQGQCGASCEGGE